MLSAVCVKELISPAERLAVEYEADRLSVPDIPSATCSMADSIQSYLGEYDPSCSCNSVETNKMLDRDGNVETEFDRAGPGSTH